MEPLDRGAGDAVMFGVVCGAGGDTLRFVSPAQSNNGWGQGRRAMKREHSAVETCSGNPAGSERQHRAMPAREAERLEKMMANP